MLAAAHLEQDVRGAEVAVTDALCMHVCHAIGDVHEQPHETRPPLRHRHALQNAVGQNARQAPAVAKLLPSTRGTSSNCPSAGAPRRPPTRGGCRTRRSVEKPASIRIPAPGAVRSSHALWPCRPQRLECIDESQVAAQESWAARCMGSLKHLYQVELEDAELVWARVVHVVDVVAVGGDDVAVTQVARDRGLGRHLRHLRVVCPTLEEHNLDRHRQTPPLPCMHAMLLRCPARDPPHTRAVSNSDQLLHGSQS